MPNLFNRSDDVSRAVSDAFRLQVSIKIFHVQIQNFCSEFIGMESEGELAISMDWMDRTNITDSLFLFVGHCHQKYWYRISYQAH